MQIVYVFSIILLAVGFLAFKKSDEKLNMIKWLTIFIVVFMGYNITVCMILGLLKITCHLWLLSGINVIFAAALGYKTVKNKDFQQYTVRKQEIVGLVVLCAIFTVIVVKEIKPQDGGLKYAAIDSAIHYRAAKHFSDNLIIFINCEDKTIYNFNVMQTGAYINDGLLMNVMNGLFGIPEYYVYEMFDIGILFLSSLVFYVLIMDKIKGKLGFVLTMFLLWLFMFAYPYSSYMYGFSYLSLGVMFVTSLLLVVPTLYGELKNKLLLAISLVSLLAMGVIFSYCLFVPGVFAAVCIYLFSKDFGEEGKTYIKFFKKKTLITTGILLVITALGIGYLFVPTFFIADQSNLVEALKNDGGMYTNLYKNFIFYIFFGLLYIGDMILKIRKMEFNVSFFVILSWVFGAYFVVGFLVWQREMISKYYFFKLYYVLWVCVLAITIRLVNEYAQKKIWKFVLPVYEGAWVLLVVLTIIFKAGTILPQEKKETLKNYVGMYFEENYKYKGLIFAFNNFAKDQIEIAEILKTIEDVKAENVLLITGSNYERAWTLAISNMQSDKIKYNEILEDSTRYELKDGLAKENVKYIVKIGMTDETADLDEYLAQNQEQDQIEVLHQSKRCYIVKKN